MLYIPSLSFFKYDASKGGVLQLLVFACRGGGVKKGTKYADVILDKPLKTKLHNFSS